MINLELITRGIDLLRKGERVAGAAEWKNAALIGDAIVAAFALIAAITGQSWEITDEFGTQIAAGIIAFWGAVNALIAVITSRKIGVLPPKQLEIDLYDELTPIDFPAEAARADVEELYLRDTSEDLPDLPSFLLTSHGRAAINELKSITNTRR